jgi:integrase
MTKSLSSEAVSAACLAFTILTAARSGEARGARWNEIDIATHTWTIPAIRMKTKRDHRVPLSNTALAILKAMQPLQRASDGLVFPGGKIDKPLSDVSLNKALAAAAGRGWTVHGLRSSFRDWVSEETGYASEIAEASLSHTIRNKVEAAYARSDLLERRAPLMQDWANYCSIGEVSGSRVNSA